MCGKTDDHRIPAFVAGLLDHVPGLDEVGVVAAATLQDRGTIADEDVVEGRAERPSTEI